MFEAKLYKNYSKQKVKCLVCQRYCQIAPNRVGFCETRLNKGGRLIPLTYGILNGIQIDPIEKKPLYHFFPGTQVLSIGSYGCNYRCKQCLNWHCSWGDNANAMLAKLKISTFGSDCSTRLIQSCFASDPAADKQNSKLDNDFISAEQLVNLTISKGYPGIAFTYNEPSIWPEYVFDAAKLAKEKGLYTVFVTNGSWSRENLKYLAPLIDAVNIDIKGFYPKTYQKMGAFFGEILAMTKLVVEKYKLHTELTTLIIPGINDSQKELSAIANWISKNLGKEIPWHLSQFSPELSNDQEFQKLPETPINTLKKAYEIGKKAGLHYIYVWAPPNFSIANTYCPKCKQLVIKRNGWKTEVIGVKIIKGKGYCQFCQENLYISD